MSNLDSKTIPENVVDATLIALPIAVVLITSYVFMPCVFAPSPERAGDNPAIELEVYTNAFNAGFQVTIYALILNGGAAAALAGFSSPFLLDKNKQTSSQENIQAILRAFLRLMWGIPLSFLSICFAYFSYWGTSSNNLIPPYESKAANTSAILCMISLALFLRAVYIIYRSMKQNVNKNL